MQKNHTLPVSAFSVNLFNFSTRFLILAVLILSSISLNAQTDASVLNQSNGFQWKEKSTIDQIIQQELTETNVSLTVPNQTDWSSAMLEAYHSLLTFTQAELQSAHDISGAMDKAFLLMRTETVSNPASRAMVIDDMKARQVELIQKLTYQ